MYPRKYPSISSGHVHAVHSMGFRRSVRLNVSSVTPLQSGVPVAQTIVLACECLHSTQWRGSRYVSAVSLTVLRSRELD